MPSNNYIPRIFQGQDRIFTSHSGSQLGSYRPGPTFDGLTFGRYHWPALIFAAYGAAAPEASLCNSSQGFAIVASVPEAPSSWVFACLRWRAQVFAWLRMESSPEGFGSSLDPEDLVGEWSLLWLRRCAGLRSMAEGGVPNNSLITSEVAGHLPGITSALLGYF